MSVNKKLIISIICQCIIYFCFCFGWIAGILIIIKFSLGVTEFIIITTLIGMLGFIFVFIDSVYGLGQNKLDKKYQINKKII